jgi:hypothetical protein
MERPEEQEDHRCIADEDIGDPSDAERPHRFDRGRQEQPDDGGNAGEEGAPGQEIAWIHEQPSQNGQRLRREREDRGVFDELSGLPLAALIARAMKGVFHGGSPRNRKPWHLYFVR